MSLENEEHHSLGPPAVTSMESQKKYRISYTRDFLLSFSELDVCKKLPPGFDKKNLSDFEDTSQDRQRIPGTFSGYRRNEYSSSPPTRVELDNYSRGLHGRWDSHSCGKSDRDSDTQSDWDSDHGRRHGNQFRRSWQGPEHDGLLGSGSFPRPSGFTAGVSAPKFRATDQYHLNKSNEPYHPPRPYKALPHSRRETNDSFNDETFGSTECTSEDKAEEEEKKRKEQQKAFQEKKINPERRKDDFDLSELLVDSKDDKGPANRNMESDEPILASKIVSEKSSLSIQTPASRPLVPPGFASTGLEKTFGIKTSMQPVLHRDDSARTKHVGSSEIEGNLSESKGNLLFNGISDDLPAKQSKQREGETSSEKRLESKIIHLLDNKKSAKAPNFSSALGKLNETISKDSHIYKSYSLSEAFLGPEIIEVTELDSKKLANKMLTETSQDGSTSILDKIFGSAVIADGAGSTNFTEPNDSNADETWSLDSSHSSKFAHLFLDEEKKSMDDLSHHRPKDLLSLIKGGEKGGSHDRMVTKHVASNFPFQCSEFGVRHVRSNLMPTGIVNSEQSWNINDVNNSAAVPTVLTCEDLEKSILSESSENDPSLPPVERWKIPDAECEKQEVNVNNHASQHLLSLLQNKTSTNTILSSANHDIRPSEMVQTAETPTGDMAPCHLIDTNAENASGSGKSLTLEALFGSAFMKELQSVGALASVQGFI
ncbi:uncharacterized protein LOC120181488 [Hibiscus syriacus]|uniref:uncharacterized protein LOC120181488 n=1 Tax=Hibiscus syriacus TaxID=106335 RepID=UPI001921F5B0|nr:uncharacterized protein LOC120181488 [Hibiscus syriacus]